MNRKLFDVSFTLLKNDFFILFLVLTLFSSINYFWLSYDTVPPSWDPSLHMISAMKYHRIISNFIDNPSFSKEILLSFFQQLSSIDQIVYPPLVQFIASFSIFIWGSSVKSLVMTNTLFTGILLFSLYKIGRKFYSNKSGLWSCFIILLYPMVFSLSRLFMLDYALLAMTALSFYFLFYSEYFHNKTYTMLFGISCGLGMLTKITFATFIIIPFMYVICLGTFQKVKSHRNNVFLYLLQILVALTIGLLIALLWYWPNFTELTRLLTSIPFKQTVAPDNSADTLFLFYLKKMITEQIGLHFFILFINGLVVFNNRVSKKNRYLLLLWMLSIYVIHTFFPHKRARQDIAILLPVCIISAIGIIDMGRMRKLATCLLLLCGIFQFLLLSLPENLFAAKLGLRNGYFLLSKSLYIKSPKKEDWRVAETLQSLGKQRARVGVLCDSEEVNGLTFRAYAIKAELPFTIDRFSHASFRHAVEDASFLKTMYKDYDFVITLSDWAPFKRFLGEFISLEEKEQVMVNHFNDHVEKNHFTLFKSFRLPDSSDVLVYKHRKRGVEKKSNRFLKADSDYDGISNEKDNCINNPNGPKEGVCTGGYTGEICWNNYECGDDGFCSMNQEDVDEDGFGDVCDFCKGNGNYDTDADGLCDKEDNCYYVFNPDQQDSSGNGVGDACMPSHIENHWLEAEQADVIVNPLEVAYDEKASEDRYIHSQNGTESQYWSSFVMALYRVNISNPGVYMLWGRVSAPNRRDNSFFIQIDDDSNMLWEIQPGNSWHWDMVNNRGIADPVRFTLTEGVHTIKVKVREDGTKLDKMVLTNYPFAVPRGMGAIAENAGYDEEN